MITFPYSLTLSQQLNEITSTAPKHPKMNVRRSSKMTSECLPEAIKRRLVFLMQENGYDDASLNVSPIAQGQIGSSCTINIEQVDRRPFRIFVKFLSASSSDFTSEASSYFHNETTFYSEILKQFGDAALTCVPRCYAVGQGSEPFIMMEDLEGYVPLKVGESLSLDLITLILEQLGRFHAHSFANRCCDATSKLEETLFTVGQRELFVRAMHDAFRLLKKSLPERSTYVETFSRFLLGVFDDLSDSLHDGDYRVVTHGDLWPNHILWKCADNTVKFVDFQACRYSSPVHDLMLLLLTGLDKVLWDAHRDELITTYHRALCNRLKEMGLDPLRVFPYSVLVEQLNKHTKLAMGVALMGLPLFYNKAQWKGCGSVFEVFERARSEKSLRCRSKMLEIIMDCIDLGWL